MLSHPEKILLAKIEQVRADLLFSEKGEEVLLTLRNHIPADLRLGRCLAKIDQHQGETDRLLLDLSQEIRSV